MVTVAEFREIHSLFLAILQPQLEHPLFLPEGVMKTGTEEDSSASPQGVSENAMAWLEIAGAAISLYRLRLYAREHGIAEPASRALLRFWVAKKTHFPEDHEKVDWLATYFFKAREQESKEPTGWVKTELQQLLKGIPTPPLGSDAQSLLGELPPLLDDARYLGAFSQITDTNLLERGREMKAQLGDDLFNPVALAAVVNYNLVLGRKFDELLDRAILQARDAAPSTNVHQLTEALHNDYRSNAGVIQQLADLTRKQLPEKAEIQVGSGPEPLLDQQLKRLGIDSTHETAKVRGRIRDLITKLMADPTIRSIRICGSPLSLQEWEVNASGLSPRNGKRTCKELLPGACPGRLPSSCALSRNSTHTKARRAPETPPGRNIRTRFSTCSMKAGGTRRPYCNCRVSTARVLCRRWPSNSSRRRTNSKPTWPSSTKCSDPQMRGAFPGRVLRSVRAGGLTVVRRAVKMAVGRELATP